jgi:hypothetical protein
MPAGEKHKEKQASLTWRGGTEGGRMTEADWLRCDNPEPMLRFAAKYISRRKELLFAVACCRRLRPWLDRYTAGLLDAVERWADEPLTVEEHNELANNALAKADGLSYRCGTPEGCARWLAGDAVYDASDRNPFGAAHGAACVVEVARQDPATFDVTKPGPLAQGDPAERCIQVALLHCLLDNPFHLTRADPAWRTPTTVQLAAAVYEEHAFERLPILADALEEVGCADANVLGHLRGLGPHARGCWVIDLLLGRG